MSKSLYNIAVAHGDGIGKEIMAACLNVFKAAKVPLTYHPVAMGKDIYLQGHSAGMTPEAKDLVERFGILYKGPMETPKGTGVKSINVTARKVWSTFANKRVFKSLPGVDTVFSRAQIPIDMTLVRENIEDTYGGIEHMQSNDVAQCRRLITRPGSNQVHHYTFELAKYKGARRVTCAHKANIMKLTDGLFLETFYETAKKYPEIKADDVIVDDLAMKMVSKPDLFDIIVLPNLQGDIISDLAAGLVGGLGMAPSANIGDKISIFEAVHGTAPDITGKNLANPTALLLSGIMMLRHLHIYDKAAIIEEGLISTLKKGYRTKDLAKSGDKALSTTDFAEAIIQNLPAQSTSSYKGSPTPFKPPVKPASNVLMKSPRDYSQESVVGVDIFVDSDMKPTDLAEHLKSVIKTQNKVKLIMLSNRGTQIWPTGSLFTECINHYRARFESADGKPLATNDLLEMIKGVTKTGVQADGSHVRLCSLEMLLKIGDKKGFSLAQGQ